jgi:Pyridoxamine 5'-phosphate oxidase
MSSSFGKHASGATSGQSSVPEPSFAERARTLMHLGQIGSLSTLSRKQPGFPFGSLMPYELDSHGRPIFLISSMAMHTQNLQADPRASLFVTEPDASGDPLGSSRVTLIGSALRVPDPELAEVRAVYLTGYPDSKYWVDFEDFFFYRGGGASSTTITTVVSGGLDFCQRYASRQKSVAHLSPSFGPSTRLTRWR